MPSPSLDALVRAPRGTRLCLAVAEELDPEVGTIATHAAWHPARAALRAGLEVALRAVDVGSLVDRSDLLAWTSAMRMAVNSAMYWQEPDDVDLLLQRPELRKALRPVAEAVVGSPAAAWWSSPADLEQLRFTTPVDGEDATPESVQTDGIGWQQWRTELLSRNNELQAGTPTPPDEAPSGYWWSTPSKPGVITTTRPLPGLGSVEMVWTEDTNDPDELAVRPVAPNRSVRVFEIDKPAAWVELVRRYPLDTTAEHRGDWYRVTGRDGTWHTPDWSAVADHYDAVHLTVTGYLTTATRSLAVSSADEDVCTMLAGWSPDQTWWLNEVLATSGAAQRWSRLDAFGQEDRRWRPDGTTSPQTTPQQRGLETHKPLQQ